MMSTTRGNQTPHPGPLYLYLLYVLAHTIYQLTGGKSHGTVLYVSGSSSHQEYSDPLGDYVNSQVVLTVTSSIPASNKHNITLYVEW